MTSSQSSSVSRVPRAFEFGPFRLDAWERQLLRDGAEIPLTGKAFDVLLLLIQSEGRTVTKETFMEHVWRGAVVEESNLADNVSTLRQILGDDAREPRYIKTVPRRGYRWVSDVNAVAAAPEPRILIHERSRTHVVIEEEQTPPATRRRPLLAAAVVAAIALVAFALGNFQSRAGKTSDRTALPPAVINPPASVTPLTTYPDHEFSPALSPDGKLLAFCWTGGTRDAINIFVRQVDVGTPVRLTSAIGRDAEPAWSPNGQFIAFVRHDPKGVAGGIYRIPALGGAEELLLAATDIGDLTWSPDGNTLAYAHKTSPGGAYEIFLLDLNTRETRRLTHPPGDTYGDYWTTFSPDGKELAFVRLSDHSAGDLHVTSLSGGPPRRITFDGRNMVGVAWDARTDSLVFSSNRDDRQILWRVAASGGTPLPLQPTVEHAVDPAVSRDGRLLVYTRSTSDTNVYRLNLGSTSAAPEVLIASSAHDHYPRLSPDGTQIAFESDRSGDYEIWLASADGSNPRQLSAARRFTASQQAWSPDGRQIAYVSRPGATSEIYVTPVAGGRPRRLTSGMNCAAPSWSRDGRFIYFSANRDGERQIWRIPAAGGTAVPITRQGGFESAESVDGRFLFYNKYGFGRVGLFRQPVAGGEEEMVHPLPQLGSLGDWQLTTKGLYFIHRYEAGVGEVSRKPSIRFLDFATGAVRTIAPFADPGSDPGLTVLEDGKAIIYSRASNVNHDLILIRNHQ